jgi:hypothetical protein
MDYEKIYENNLGALLQSVEDGLPVREIIDFNKIYEAIENVNNKDNEVTNYEIERRSHKGEERYKYFNKEKDLDKEVDYEIKLVNNPEKIANGIKRFYINRIFDDNRKDDTVGYITYFKEIKTGKESAILDVGIFRTMKCFDKKVGVSVIAEMKNLIINTLTNDPTIGLIHWTCIDDDNNPVKKIFEEKFSQYTKGIPIFDERIKKNVITYIMTKESIQKN